MKFLLILIVLILFLMLLALVKVKAILTYDNEFGFVLKFGVIKLYSNSKKDGKEKKANKSSSKDSGIDAYTGKLKTNFSTVKKLTEDVFSKFRKHLVFDIIELRYEYGFKDAALTGVFYGVASGLSNIFLAYIDNTFKVKKIVNEITPDFNNTKNKISFKTEFGIRLIYLLVISIKFVKFLTKLK